MSLERNEFHIEVADADATAVDLLSMATNQSKQKIKQAMQKGAVWLSDNKGTHRLRRHSKKLQLETTLHFYFDPAVLYEDVEDAELVADEGDYSIWYKPRGMLSQGSKWGDHNAINRWVEKQLKPERPAFIVHRLDRFASGLIILAHKKKTAQKFSAMFQKKEIHKQYKVIVQGHFPNGEMKLDSDVQGKSALSYANLLNYDKDNNISLVNMEIETGRKHQIRIHLADAGFPVLGDRLHGDKNSKVDLQLTAYKLSFLCLLDGSQKDYLLADKYQPSLSLTS